METIEERLERIERLTLLSAKTALNMDDMAASAPMPLLSSLHTRKPQSSYGLRKKWEWNEMIQIEECFLLGFLQLVDFRIIGIGNVIVEKS